MLKKNNIKKTKYFKRWVVSFPPFFLVFALFRLRCFVSLEEAGLAELVLLDLRLRCQKQILSHTSLFFKHGSFQRTSAIYIRCKNVCSQLTCDLHSDQSRNPICPCAKPLKTKGAFKDLWDCWLQGYLAYSTVKPSKTKKVTVVPPLKVYYYILLLCFQCQKISIFFSLNKQTIYWGVRFKDLQMFFLCAEVETHGLVLWGSSRVERISRRLGCCLFRLHSF